MRLPRIALLALLTLNSCGALDGTVDHAADRTEALVSHTVDEVRSLKTETLQEVRTTLNEVVPEVVDKAVAKVLGNEAIAFLIVSVTFLLGLVVLVALYLLVGSVRTWWKGKRRLDC